MVSANNGAGSYLIALCTVVSTAIVTHVRRSLKKTLDTRGG